MDRQEPLVAAGRRALDAAASGRADALDGLEAALAGAPPGAEVEAWRLAARAARAVIASPGGRLPSVEEVRRFSGADSGARTAAAEACALLARSALLELDAGALAAWTALGPALDDTDPRLAVRWELSRAWHGLLGGDAAGVEARAHAAQTAAAAAQLGAMVIEAVSLRAMAALAAEQPAEATALARRASMMAASERLETEMSLANLVLARVRRHTGRPHLAARIAGIVAGWAPAPFAAWVCWERAVAGGNPPPVEPRPDGAAFAARFSGAAEALLTLLGAARAGRREDAAAAVERLHRHLAQAVPFAAEAAALAAASDPWLPGDGPLSAWASGASPLPPYGLHGLCHARDEAAADRGDTTACVVVLPGGAGRRVLRVGLERAAARAGSAVTGELDQAQSRTDTGLCVLALAGPAGLPVEEFFRQIYGFAYSPPLHRSILNVLVHRMRKRLPGAAEVERDGDQVRLTAAEPLAILDARCSEPAVQRVLWLLARRGSATAKDAAQVLGIPLRTAQAALQQLAADGSCTASKDGKQLSYRIDDTTFSEPTPLVRL